MKCYFNDCAGEGRLSMCCLDCSDTACPDRCPFKDRTACIWATEGKEHEAKGIRSETGAEDPDLH